MLKRLAQRKLNKIGKIFFRVNYMLETPRLWELFVMVKLLTVVKLEIRNKIKIKKILKPSFSFHHMLSQLNIKIHQPYKI